MLADMKKGAAAILASAASIGASTLESIEVWLRIAGLLGGLVVTSLTAISLWRGMRKKSKKE